MVTTSLILLLLGVMCVSGGLLGGLGAAIAPRLLPSRSRRRVVAWAAVGRGLRGLRRAGLGLCLAGAVLHPSLLSPEGRRLWPALWGILPVGGISVAGAYALLLAGRLERAGRVRRARCVARLGGEWAFVAGFGVLILMWIDLLFRPAFRLAIVRDDPRAALLLAGGMLALGCAAFIALLTGLTGKPRPGGGVVTVLLLGGIVATAVAGDRVRDAFDPLTWGDRDGARERLLD